MTPEQFLRAATVGCGRRIRDMFAGRTERNNAPQDQGWHRDVIGAAGELAFATWAGLPWTGNGEDMKAPDVGHIEVRTARCHHWAMPLHPWDHDGRPYVLVTGTGPLFLIHGWVWGREGKLPRFWADPLQNGRPAFFVPQAALRSIHERP